MKPEDYPDVIYKYRSWDNEYHKNILLNGELYMSPPKDFNDPFDCRITTNHYLIDTTEKINEYVNRRIEKYKGWLIENHRDIDFERKRQIERLKSIETYQKECEDLEYSEMDKYLGVLSLSERWDSILMWSHYGDFHKGFCIGFNEEKLRKGNFFLGGGRVNYLDDFPIIDPLNKQDIIEKSFLQTHSKAKDWKYEKEYRFIKLYYPIEPTNEQRKVLVPIEYIEEVNLGMNISKEHRDEILEMCKCRGVKVYQTEKVSFKFELIRNLIS